MPGLRPEYLIPLLLLGLLFLGPKRIPEMGAAIGKTIKEFQRSMREPAEPKETSVVLPPAVPVQAQQVIAAPAPVASAPSENAPTATPANIAEPAQQ